MTTAAIGAAAFAHPYTYTVSVGGSTAPASHLFYASDVNGIDFSVKRLSDATVTPMSCDEVNAEGEVYSGTGIDPIGVIKQVSLANAPDIVGPANNPGQATEWKGCTGPFGLDMTVKQLNDWEVHADGTNPTSALTNIVSGYVSGPNNDPLRAHVFATLGGKEGTSCNFIVEGYADGNFDESDQTLNITETGFSGDLTVVSTEGDCFELVPAGSPADFEGSFEIGKDDSGNTKGNITVNHPINLISTP
ncbi:hypothetical protein [Nocardioides alcanivorans]|uniref:hypothetical protein n=1 Tax=Nocardioides alcanivorans TaxID=2897352 RepID=UPI001F272C77|nr:hypothetical protein [Nocardioides alcanivorans]